jgi:uncharacterized protein (TIGR03382 family)
MRVFTAFLLAISFGSSAAAQIRLSGTYIDYFGVRDNGTFINSANESMRYSESGMAPYGCDTFFPGTPSEGFTVEAMGSARIDATNNQTRSDVPTTVAAALSGREITWTGEEVNGANAITIAERVTYAMTDRIATVQVTLTNSGTTMLNDVYYLRTGDPDFGVCSIGTSYDTTNDVLQQPPAFASALITASAGGLTLGLGAADPRARVSTGSGLVVTDAAGIWSAPIDPDGSTLDTAIALVFREATLAAGASVTFTFYYVWGTTPAVVQARFDTATGVACMGEGTACSAGGRDGTCRSGRCCLGCWDGSLCQVGDSLDQCGGGGGMCEGCVVDENICTSEVCEGGMCMTAASAEVLCDDGMFCTENDRCMGEVCMGTVRACDDMDPCSADSCDEASRRCVFDRSASCTIDGMCVAGGSANPANACQICDTSASASRWTPVAAGTECGTPSCTGGMLMGSSRCDASGMCMPGDARPCPSGMCADATTCAPIGGADGGIGSDAGVTPGPTGRDDGCCSTTGLRPGSVALAALVALFLVSRRRRR